MSLLLLFSTAFVVALSGALMPGPLLTLTLAHAPKAGWRFGPLAIAGHGLLEATLIAAVWLGAGSLLTSAPVQAGLGLAGGAILAWMGAGMLRAARPGGSGGLPAAAGGPRRGRAVLLGALASIANPYWSLWWATVGLAYLSVAAERGAAGVAVFFAGHLSGDLAWYTAVAAAAARGADLAGSRFTPRLLAACAVMLCALGAWFLWKGASSAAVLIGF
jgi:threonine/homoserine/homoserine lactone efflux protein